MTRQLCVYIKRARGNTQKSIHGQTIEKRANILNTQEKYIPASAKKRKFCRYLQVPWSLQYFFTEGIQPNIYKNSILLPWQPTKHSTIMWYYKKSLAMTTAKRLYCWIIWERHQRPNVSHDVRNVANVFFLCFRRLFGLRPTLNQEPIKWSLHLH